MERNLLILFPNYWNFYFVFLSFFNVRTSITSRFVYFLNKTSLRAHGKLIFLSLRTINIFLKDLVNNKNINQLWSTTKQTTQSHVSLIWFLGRFTNKQKVYCIGGIYVYLFNNISRVLSRLRWIMYWVLSEHFTLIRFLSIFCNSMKILWNASFYSIKGKWRILFIHRRI